MAPQRPDYFFPDPGLVERRIRLKPLYRGRAVSFHVDDIRLPNGRTATREYLHHHGAVGVLPFLDQDTVVLVRQYRYPVGEVTLEMPAGKLDPGENHLACIKRELREETGYTARRIRHLIDYWPTCAFSDELLRLYIADGLRPGQGAPDHDEFIEAVAVPFREALRLVWKGRIKDSKTIIALLAARPLV
ncbi:MAG: NUDIX hydrolase [Elusimicrobia bacterium]|nr:NUDIX hydrolase [Elusimicrobiota bacterium]